MFHSALRDIVNWMETITSNHGAPRLNLFTVTHVARNENKTLRKRAIASRFNWLY